MGKESDGYVRSDAVPRSTMTKMMKQRINSRTKILQEIVNQTKHDITFPPLPVHRISAHFFFFYFTIKEDLKSVSRFRFKKLLKESVISKY